MNYVLDTNIVLYYLKRGATFNSIEKQFSPFASQNRPIVSIVTVGELFSLALQRKWGDRKLSAANDFFQYVTIVDVRYNQLIKLYSEIDAFSQVKYNVEAADFTARNMGKNDLWIAATTVLAKAELLTPDLDFQHLDNKYFKVNLIEQI